MGWVAATILGFGCVWLARRWSVQREAARAAGAAAQGLRDELHSILDNLGSGLMVVDRAGVILRLNPAACQILDVDAPSLAGQVFADAFPDGLHGFTCAVARVLADGEPVLRRETQVTRSDGAAIPIGVSVHPLADGGRGLTGAVAIFQDLGGEFALRERIRENDRLAAIGELSASIAHEIRNPLGSIRGSAELLAAESGAGGEERRLLDLILKESERVNRIVSDFLAYARLRPTQPQLVELKPYLDAVALQVRMHARGAARPEITAEVRPDDLLVYMDAEQIQQVLLNLALNACEAMGQGGRLTLRAELDDDNSACLLTVADTGPGIPAEVRERMYEPFFTTKPAGTGLGLPVVRRIVLAHGGGVEVQDAPGGGTVFRIELPLTGVPRAAADAKTPVPV